ncbi:Aklanonic acid methyl ester cyclase AcmA [Streptomyces glaucescens]
MIQAYNTGNTDDVTEYIHPDYLNPASMEHMDLRGPDSFAMAVKWLRMTFSEEARLEEVQLEERGE